MVEAIYCTEGGASWIELNNISTAAEYVHAHNSSRLQRVAFYIKTLPLINFHCLSKKLSGRFS